MIDIKTIKKSEPGKLGGGQCKYYASITNRKTIDTYQLAQEISKICTLTPIDTKAVIEALLYVIPQHLSNGDIVKLNDFGSFYLIVNSFGESHPNLINEHSIRNTQVRFNPTKRMQLALGQLTFRKVKA